ncbi:HopJ type III effector protein [Vibrio vulnificus]|nr:HopJ type III effector protein [Vibrio vulnificus]EIZ1048023.1 HopJ type III effector protein [Vibrio vulnificus]
MSLKDLLAKLAETPEAVEFQEVIDVIDSHYVFVPAAFQNGDTHNEAGQNNGSCKIFSFAQLNELNEEQTLACFGRYYRHDVLLHPKNDDHQNIRNFIRFGWSGVQFDTQALTEK